MLRAPLRLRRETYQSLVRRLDSGDLHPTLVGGEKWYPEEEARQLDQRADLELSATGWNSRDFADLITLLQHPAVEHYCWARINGDDLTLQAASRGREAVLAIAHGEAITFFPSSAETAPRDLVSALPDTKPVPNLHSLSCSEQDYTAVLSGQPPPTRTGSARDARRAAEWMRAPRVHVGRLYVAVRRGTERIRNARPPYWIDVEQGRFTATAKDDWLSISAASGDDLARMFRGIETELRS